MPPPNDPSSPAPQDPSPDEVRRRVAELETHLSDEQATAAARLFETERGMQILRTTVQELQTRAQEATAERDRLAEEREALVEQLEEARRTVHALSEACGGGPEAELASLRDTVTALRERVAVLESVVDQRERDVLEARAMLETSDAERAELAARLEVAEQSAREAAAGDRPKTRAPALPRPAARAAAEDRSALFGSDTTTDPSAAAPDEPAPAGRSPGPASPRARPPAAGPSVAAPSAPAERPAAVRPDPSFPEIPGIRIERLVSDDAEGVVYDAREVTTRRAVCVRILPQILHLLDGAKLDSLLLARHANLVAVHAFGLCKEGPYLVLERAEGETADAWVRRVGPLPERTALAVALETARGLRQAAAHGALHGDLSPDCVFVDPTGRVRVGGCGLRGVLTPGDDSPRAPDFASQERLRGTTAWDARSDIYSLGAVVWFLLTGRAPGAAPRADVPGRAGAPNDLRAQRPDVSEETAKLLRRMLSADPSARHRTWDQVLVDLENRQPGAVSPEIRANLEQRARRALAARPWLLSVFIGIPFAATLGVHFATRSVSTVEDRWHEARDRAEDLVEAGQVENARRIYRTFVSGTGDVLIEREARRRLEALTTK